MEKHNLDPVNNVLEDNNYNWDDKVTLTSTEPKLTKEEILARKKEAVEYIIPIVSYGTPYENIQLFIEHIKVCENCYYDFMWTKIYSLDLINISKEQWCDLENAFYLQLYWRTKIEHEKYLQEQDQIEKHEKTKKRLDAIEKVPWWIEKGKEYIDDTKLSDWEDYVNSSVKDMFYWSDVDDTLKILGLIEEWKSWQEIQEIFDKDCDDIFYYGAVRKQVIYFSKKWAEAMKNLKKKL